jgi:hypothetical protein
LGIHEHFDHGTIEPFAGLSPCIPLDGEDADAGDLLSENQNFGSLLGVGTRKAKKRPVLILDPEEARAAALEIQQVAAYDFANGTTSAPDHEPPGLSSMKPARIEPEIAEGPEPVAIDEWAQPDPADTSVESIAESEPVETASPIAMMPRRWTDEPAPPPADDPFEGYRGAEAATCPEPFALAEVEALPPLAPASELDLADDGQEWSEPPLAPEPREEAFPPAPDPTPQGHGLRAELARAQEARQTRADQLLALGRRLLAWARRRWL